MCYLFSLKIVRYKTRTYFVSFFFYMNAMCSSSKFVPIQFFSNTRNNIHVVFLFLLLIFERYYHGISILLFNIGCEFQPHFRRSWTNITSLSFLLWCWKEFHIYHGYCFPLSCPLFVFNALR